MTSRNLIAIGAAALALGLSATAFAAQSEPQGDFTYRTSPPSSNPHDVFRTLIKVPRTPEAAARMRMANCDCPMMKGDAAMRDMCMTTMGVPTTSPKG
ncbi:MAG: hypothetical protein EPN98_16365 [Phenylobacterium sp.]|uniref:hypothetical protein n=1 Tax=Phenylobacterium sp. TaxID=1871053 RepID=UPI001224C92A|nr:hypothetical protein [Phenylobacterium sp.]TAL31250.1 MAG: hypothetical protein EPN98_16365 [Phenylobacterium sp.]